MKKGLFFAFIFVGLLTQNAASQSASKNNILWIDPLKNISEITNRSGITRIMNSAASSGFQGVALSIKTNTGQVIYESEIAPRLLEWGGVSIPLDFDIIREFSEQALSKDMIFYAVYPVFAGGNMVERKGLLYDEHPDWQSYVYVVENEEPEIIPITQWAFGTIAYSNPLNTAMQNYEISVINEFLDEYTVGGFIFDKMRFYGIEADFSDETKAAFERSLGGQSLNWWPQDVFEWQFQNEKWEIIPGQRFQDWIKFRATNIKNISRKFVQAAKKKDLALKVGNFVGSWYPTYYEYGVNWASRDYRPEGDWVPREYDETALAEEFDYMIVGSFYPRVTMQDAEAEGADWWMSVEGGIELATEAIGPRVPVYGALLVEQFKNDREKFKLALETALQKTDGLFITDLSHIRENNFWNTIGIVLAGQQDTKVLR